MCQKYADRQIEKEKPQKTPPIFSYLFSDRRAFPVFIPFYGFADIGGLP